ncbi:MAG: bifunctional nuclease family protein [Dehalococcoidales bacterium]
MEIQRTVILKEKMSQRYLPIRVDPVKLTDVAVPRPLTHDLLNSVINSLGASVHSIIVNDLKNDTFFAKAILEIDGKQVEIDSRPSDALALAVRVGAPIFVEETVLDKAGILLDKESGKPVLPQTSGKNAQVSKEELDRISVFTEFVNTLPHSLQRLGWDH